MGHRDVKKPQKKAREKLEKIKEILSMGAKTLRRVFYMLASGSYDALGKLIVWARLHGEISWDSIREEGRYLEGSRDYKNIEEFINEVVTLYKKEKTSSFKNYFEVWLEKATLRDIFFPICDKYGVGLLTTRGTISWTALKKASERLNSKSKILYFGDNDSFGNRMFLQNKLFLAQLGSTPKFEKLALTDAQEKKYNFPKGEHHLDGMPEEALKELLETGIRNEINLKKFNSVLKEEEREREKLKEIIK